MSDFKPKFWKPGSSAPGAHLKEERVTGGDENGQVLHYKKNTSLSVEQQRQGLPIFRHRNHILYLIEKYQTVVIVGETGCGKSTQLCQYLLEAGWAAGGRVIAVTQPRRVAAVTVATRVAEEQAAILGHQVGYAIRFDSCFDDDATRIKFVTDGLLIREMMSDPLLSRYSVIMLDEAHERSLHTDLIVGLLKKIQRKRIDLKIIVASATLDAEKMRDFFNTDGVDGEDTAAVLTVEGRMYPVDIFHSLNPLPDYVKATVETVMKIHHSNEPGDVLAFLTGQEEVQHVMSLLIDQAKQLPKDAMKMRILPMYSSLPYADQARVFDRTSRNCRKIIIATNIAEASITISGIVHVIDAGFVKLRAFNPHCAMETLVIVAISQASAIQRAGRAGRMRSGKVYRLYTQQEYSKLDKNMVPEIQRSNMARVIVQLKALGVDNILRFPFISPPPAENMLHGIELLSSLGAIDDRCQLTIPLGMTMAEFPLDPMYTKVLLSSEEFGCSEEVLTIAAILQIENVFIAAPNQRKQAERCKRKFAAAQGDHISMLNVYNAFLQYNRSSRWCQTNLLHYKGLCRAVEIRTQLERLLRKTIGNLASCNGDVEVIQKCITNGLFANAARLHPSGEYRTVRNDYTLSIHPTSVLYVEKPPDWLVFGDVVHTKKEYMRDVTVIKPEWLYELAPQYYQFGTERELAAKRARLH